MNFHQLNVFYEVAKAKSFTAAAEKLYLTQPAVTLQIQNMEKYYETKLFEHVGKRIVLTKAGEVLFEFAKKIFNLARLAEEAIADFRKLDKGLLKIDSVFTFADYYLPILLEAFYKKYPKITIEVRTGNTSQIINDTLLHRNDIAFAAYKPETDKLVAIEFISDRLVGIVSLDHKFAQRESIAVEELNGEPLILRERGSSPRKIVDEVLKTKGVFPEIVMESGSTSAIKRVVEAGMGMAILSQQAVKQEVEAQTLKEVHFSDAQIAYQFFLILHKEKYVSTLLKAFLDIATEYALKLSAA
jgi:DNA-binding transcriptional LysR family regulator